MKITESEVLSLLQSIATGAVKLTAELEPEDVYAGDVDYVADNGWKITIFNDCNEWDYIDSVTAPDGRRLDFDDIADGMPKAYGYRPSAKVAWYGYGIPGYLKHSGKRRPWRGWTAKPTPSGGAT